MVMDAASVAVVDTGAAATSVRSEWLKRRGEIFVPPATAHPACARFKFGHGRLVAVRCPADFPVEVAGIHGKFATFVLEADVPAPSPQGASEALWGAVGPLSLQQGTDFPPKLSSFGRCVLSG